MSTDGILVLYVSVFTMASSALRFFIIVCVGAILLPTITGCARDAHERRRISLWDKNDTPRLEFQRPVSDDMERLSRSLREGFSPSAEQTKQTLLAYGTFLGIVAVAVACFLAWQTWRRKKIERQFSDPMFLVHELNSAHQLSEQEKRVMQTLSERNLLPTPLKLFIEPQYLLDAWESETFASSQPTVRVLLSKLFDIAKA